MENIKINKQEYEMHSLELLSTDDSTIQVFLMKQNSKLDSIGLEIIKDKAETFLVFKDLETYKNSLSDDAEIEKAEKLITYFANNRANASVFRTKIVPPLGYAMCFVYSIERYFHLP